MPATAAPNRSSIGGAGTSVPLDVLVVLVLPVLVLPVLVEVDELVEPELEVDELDDVDELTLPEVELLVEVETLPEVDDEVLVEDDTLPEVEDDEDTLPDEEAEELMGTLCDPRQPWTLLIVTSRAALHQRCTSVFELQQGRHRREVPASPDQPGGEE